MLTSSPAVPEFSDVSHTIYHFAARPGRCDQVHLRLKDQDMACAPVDQLLIEDLFSMIESNASDECLVRRMHERGIDDPAHVDQLLADAKMNHQTITRMQQQIDDLQQQNQILRQQNQALQQQNHDLQQQNQALQQQHRDLQQQVNDLQNQAAEAAAERTQSEERATRVRRALQSLECEPYDHMRRGFETCRVLYGIGV